MQACLLEPMRDVTKAFEEQNLSLTCKVFARDRFIDTGDHKLYPSFWDNDATYRQAYVLSLRAP